MNSQEENVSNNSGSVVSNTLFDIRKGIRINKFQEENWDPEYIREHLDTLSNSDVKQMKESLSNSKNHTIRLTENQARKWDSDIVKHFLDVKQGVKHPVGQENGTITEGFEIIVNMFNEFMSLDSEFKMKVREYFTDERGNQSQSFSDLMKAFNLIRGK